MNKEQYEFLINLAEKEYNKKVDVFYHIEYCSKEPYMIDEKEEIVFITMHDFSLILISERIYMMINFFLQMFIILFIFIIINFIKENAEFIIKLLFFICIIIILLTLNDLEKSILTALLLFYIIKSLIFK